jgi:adenylate cyclase
LLVTFARGRDTAQARVEALLLNVLPAEVAQRLQFDPNSIADHFDNASILFADVVDFTPLSSRLDAREVVERSWARAAVGLVRALSKTCFM